MNDIDTSPTCEMCGKNADKLEIRIVPALQTVMQICKECENTNVTYDPTSFHRDGSVSI